MVTERVRRCEEGVMIQWKEMDPLDWRVTLETSQHVPHSPQQGKLKSQVLHTSTGREFTFNWVVIAAGAHSPTLLKDLQRDVATITDRTYAVSNSLNPNSGEKALTRPILFHAEDIRCCPLAHGGASSAGTIELGEVEDTPTWGRAELVHSQSSKLLAQHTEGPDPAIPAVDARALLSDSLPMVGPALYKRPNILCNFAHGHWPLSLAAPAAALITDFIAGRPPRVDVKPFQVDRKL